MATNIFKTILAGLLCASFLDAVICSPGYPGGPDTALVYSICNGQRANAGFGIESDNVIWGLISHTPDEGFDLYKVSNILEGTEFAYGHAACNGKLTKSACSVCLQQTVGPIFCDTSSCGSNGCTGAQVQLQDCRMRYENSPFID